MLSGGRTVASRTKRPPAHREGGVTMCHSPCQEGKSENHRGTYRYLEVKNRDREETRLELHANTTTQRNSSGPRSELRMGEQRRKESNLPLYLSDRKVEAEKRKAARSKSSSAAGHAASEPKTRTCTSHSPPSGNDRQSPEQQDGTATPELPRSPENEREPGKKKQRAQGAQKCANLTSPFRQRRAEHLGRRCRKRSTQEKERDEILRRVVSGESCDWRIPRPRL